MWAFRNTPKRRLRRGLYVHCTASFSMLGGHRDLTSRVQASHCVSLSDQGKNNNVLHQISSMTIPLRLSQHAIADWSFYKWCPLGETDLKGWSEIVFFCGVWNDVGTFWHGKLTWGQFLKAHSSIGPLGIHLCFLLSFYVHKRSVRFWGSVRLSGTHV